jgi:multisubunit Na+/H+ antiporter MnhB subunit
MFYLDVLQGQWVILAVGGGLALALVLALVYLAFWRNRAGGDAEADARPRRVPWFLILLYAAILVYWISYMVFNIRHPPTW